MDLRELMGKPPKRVTINQNERWKVTTWGESIEIELLSLVFTDKEVLEILDDYKKALDERIAFRKKMPFRFVADVEFIPKGG